MIGKFNQILDGGNSALGMGEASSAGLKSTVSLQASDASNIGSTETLFVKHGLAPFKEIWSFQAWLFAIFTSERSFVCPLLYAFVPFVKGSALPLGKINCWTGVPGTNENCSMMVKGHSGLPNQNL